jgi:hypothetical protein
VRDDEDQPDRQDAAGDVDERPAGHARQRAHAFTPVAETAGRLCP